MSPCKIIFKGKVVCDDLTDFILEGKFIERVKLLILLYSDMDLEDFNDDFFGRYIKHRDICYKENIKKPYILEFSKEDMNLVKISTAHRSSRQNKLLKMDGFTGEIKLNLLNSSDFSPLLMICKFMNIGSYTTAGFGHFSSSISDIP